MAGCTSYYEGTELKANHNHPTVALIGLIVVLAITKVLNWKLITTYSSKEYEKQGCTSYYEGTELKANHNKFIVAILPLLLY